MNILVVVSILFGCNPTPIDRFFRLQ